MSNETTTTVAAAHPIPEWVNACRTLLSSPTVLITFRGLLAFCYNDETEECEVGVHNASDHFLTVVVLEGPKEVHRWKGHAASLVNSSYALHGSSGLASVCFYQQVGVFNRATDDDDQHDFRWILDLETSEFYGPPGGRRRLEKRGSVLKPRFTLDTGQFHTARRSTCLYRRQNLGGDEGSRVPLGKIATDIGVNIFLGPLDHADISLPGGYNVRMTARKTYKILFANDCDDESCVDPTSTNPELQNDFRFYHSTFNRRPEDPLLYLMKEEPTCLEPLRGPGEGTQRAPCASAGYGGGGGLGG